MKSRIGKTSFDSLNDAQKKICEAYVLDYWDKLRAAISDRYFYAMALAINDVYGFGEKRVLRAVNAFAEIVIGYSEETYTPKEKRERAEDMAAMAENMRQELLKRGIDLGLHEQK